ncbi:hypothetical protein OG552_32120 [Streptomyces sp. NBC_01476]|uniref:hypothetical protein n=1 Tax=Streptomyces sp. NBC_01476 TaxID=2903881 RepID=UPI002E360386|nr:hypothetical protein [Streptomyces sp. NBC_01476]
MDLGKSAISRVAAIACVTMVALGSGAASEAASASPQIGGTTGCPSSGYIEHYFTCTSLSNGVLQHYKYTNDIAETAYYKTGGSATSAAVGYGKGSSSVYAGAKTISSGQSVDASWSGVAYCTSTVGLLKASSGLYQTPPATC